MVLSKSATAEVGTVTSKRMLQPPAGTVELAGNDTLVPPAVAARGADVEVLLQSVEALGVAASTTPPGSVSVKSAVVVKGPV